MRLATKPTTYLSIEELRQMAVAKFDEAALLEPGPERDDVLKSAHSFRNLAEMKGWLSSELQPPK